MLFAYVDESGDPGSPFGPRPGSDAYTLGVVLIPADQWTHALDTALSFRRRLRSSFGIPLRAEIKAHYLVKNRGWFKGKRLSSKQRKHIITSHLRLTAAMNAHAFAVYLDKRALMDPKRFRIGVEGPEEQAWVTLFQRLALTYQRANSTPTPIHLSHDEGNNSIVRYQARKARRFLTAGQAFGASQVRLPSGWLIDDPVPRNSVDSYFIQLADIVAWTAARTMVPPGASGRRVFANWNHLGSACYTVVNRLAVQRNPKAVPGIAVVK